MNTPVIRFLQRFRFFVVNGSALTTGIDYEVIYLKNIAPGRAAISVNGLGDYAVISDAIDRHGRV